jgi:hypothetical protein
MQVGSEEVRVKQARRHAGWQKHTGSQEGKSRQATRHNLAGKNRQADRQEEAGWNGIADIPASKRTWGRGMVKKAGRQKERGIPYQRGR